MAVAESPFGVIDHPSGHRTVFVPFESSHEGRTKYICDSSLPPTTEQMIASALTACPLPFAGDISGIIGSGSWSVALRLSTTDKSYALVAKPMQSVTAIPDEDLPLSQPDPTLDRFKIPVSGVVTEGPNHTSIFYKVSREVPGRVLQDTPLAEIVGNPVLSEGLADLCHGLIDHFAATRKMVGITGQVGRNKIRNVINHFSPLFSRNIVVDSGTSKPVLVDVSNWQGYGDPNTGSLKDRATPIVDLLGTIATEKFLRGVTHLHALRNRVFPLSKDSQEVEDHFSGNVREALTRLNDSGLNYRVVGSLALKALLDERGVDLPYPPHRVNGELRDIDVIVLDKPDNCSELKSYFASRQKDDPLFPEVSLSPIIEPTCPAYDKSLSGYMSFNSRTADGQYCKRLGVETLELSDQDMAARTAVLFGVPFATLRPEIVAGLYLGRGGGIKFKDAAKVNLLLESTHASIPHKFVDFASRMQTTYPDKHANFIFHEFADYWSGNKLRVWKKHLIDLTHKLTPHRKDLASPALA